MNKQIDFTKFDFSGMDNVGIEMRKEYLQEQFDFNLVCKKLGIAGFGRSEYDEEKGEWGFWAGTDLNGNAVFHLKDFRTFIFSSVFRDEVNEYLKSKKSKETFDSIIENLDEPVKFLKRIINLK